MKADTRKPFWGGEEESYNDHAKVDNDIKNMLGCDDEWRIPRLFPTTT